MEQFTPKQAELNEGLRACPLEERKGIMEKALEGIEEDVAK